MVKLMNSGNKIMSSKNPSTGMKSGIRSIGDSAYMIVISANTLASVGVSFLCKAINIDGTSIFNCLARCFKFIF